MTFPSTNLRLRQDVTIKRVESYRLVFHETQTELDEVSETMTTLPPLPPPGQQSPEDRRAISRRVIQQARQELAQGHRLQAGEKVWGAAAQHLKIIGQNPGMAPNESSAIGEHWSFGGGRI